VKYKWVTPGIRVTSIKLKFCNRLVKESNISEEFTNIIVSIKIYNKVISEAKRLANNMQMKRSGNKSEAMRDLIKEELGNQKK
jgi:hypothetical protein